MNTYALTKMLEEAMTPMGLLFTFFLYVPPAFFTGLALVKYVQSGTKRALLLLPFYIFFCISLGFLFGLLFSVLFPEGSSFGGLFLLYALFAEVGVPAGILFSIFFQIIFSNSLSKGNIPKL